MGQSPISNFGNCLIHGHTNIYNDPQYNYSYLIKVVLFLFLYFLILIKQYLFYSFEHIKKNVFYEKN